MSESLAALSARTDAMLVQLEKETREMLREYRAMRDALYECLEYFEDREDVVDGDYGMPEANQEMTLAMSVRRALGEGE